jgi:hypothetical protein
VIGNGVLRQLQGADGKSPQSEGWDGERY